MPSPLDSNSYSINLVRFWRIPWHREALQILAVAVTHSSEADYLAYEWELLCTGNRMEYALRRDWALSIHKSNIFGWRDTSTWASIVNLYGPPRARHSGCLCKWLHLKNYPQVVSAHGGGGDAGGRARRLIADLDSAVAALPPGMTRERDRELFIARYLGWLPTPPSEDAFSREDPAA